MLGTVFCDVHPVELLYKIALPQDGSDHGKAAGWNNTFIRKLNDNLFVFVHDKMLLSHVCSYIHYNSYGLENRANIMNLQHPMGETEAC